MLKTLTAALVAASVLIAPIASANAAQPATKPATTTTKVVKLNKHRHHVARHHSRVKVVKHVRGHKKIVVIKKVRHGKFVKAHRHNHVAKAKAPAIRAN